MPLLLRKLAPSPIMRTFSALARTLSTTWESQPANEFRAPRKTAWRASRGRIGFAVVNSANIVFLFGFGKSFKGPVFWSFRAAAAFRLGML